MTVRPNNSHDPCHYYMNLILNSKSEEECRMFFEDYVNFMKNEYKVVKMDAKGFYTTGQWDTEKNYHFNFKDDLPEIIIDDPLKPVES